MNIPTNSAVVSLRSHNEPQHKASTFSIGKDANVYKNHASSDVLWCAGFVSLNVIFSLDFQLPVGF